MTIIYLAALGRMRLFSFEIGIWTAYVYQPFIMHADSIHPDCHYPTFRPFPHARTHTYLLFRTGSAEQLFQTSDFISGFKMDVIILWCAYCTISAAFYLALCGTSPWPNQHGVSLTNSLSLEIHSAYQLHVSEDIRLKLYRLEGGRPECHTRSLLIPVVVVDCWFTCHCWRFGYIFCTISFESMRASISSKFFHLHIYVAE